MLTGYVAVKNNNNFLMLSEHQSGPRRIQSFDKEYANTLPAEIIGFVQKITAHKPEDRYQSAEEARAALLKIQRELYPPQPDNAEISQIQAPRTPHPSHRK